MSVSTVVARFALLSAFLAMPLSAGAALTLAEAERLALEQAPGLARARASVAAADSGNRSQCECKRRIDHQQCTRMV